MLFSQIVHIGDVTQVKYKDGVLHTQFGSYKTKIDMVIGGSPCQSFSVAGDGSEIIVTGKQIGRASCRERVSSPV